MDRVKIKAKAKEFAFNNMWNVWKAILLVGILSGLASSSMVVFGGENTSWIASLVAMAVEIFLMPLQIGMFSYILKLVRGKKVELTEELFSKYKSEYMWDIILVSLITGLIIALMSILLIIPGIIYAIKFAMTSFILAEQDEKELKEHKAYEVSSKMMEGHKWEFFVFQLSFIGWYFLCVITLGIASIWIVPYTTVASAMWYDELKKISK